MDETRPAFEGIKVAVSEADFLRISAHRLYDQGKRCVFDPDGLRIDLVILNEEVDI